MRVVPVGLYVVIYQFVCGISFPPPAQLVSFAPQQPEKLLLKHYYALETDMCHCVCVLY